MRILLVISAFALLLILPARQGHAQTSSLSQIDQRLHTADSLRRKLKFSDAWNQLSMIKSQQDKMDTEQLAKDYKVLGVTQVGLRKYTDALESYANSKAQLETLASPKSQIDLVNIYTFEGTIYNQTGDYEKAREILLSGIEAAQRLPQEDKVKTIKYLYNNLAETYELLGQYDEAVKTTNLALDIIAELGQEVSVGAGVANNNLGICYGQLGRYQLAKKHYSQAAEIFAKSLGPNSRYTHAALGNAATAIDDYGDVEKAIPILNKRLEVYQEDPGADQVYIVNTYSTLGFVYKRIGDYEKSGAAYERALGKLRSMSEYKKDLEIRLLNSLATNEIHQESMVNARLHLDEALAIQEATQALALADLVRLNDTDATYYMLNDQQDNFFLAIENAHRISSKDSTNQLGLILRTRPRYIDALINKGKFQLAELQIDSTLKFIQDNITRIPSSTLLRVQADLDGRKAKLACETGKIKEAFAAGLDQKLQQHVKGLISATALTPGKKNQRHSSYNIGDLLDALANLHLQADEKKLDSQTDHLQKALAVLDIKQSYLTNIWKNEHFSGLPIAQKEEAKELRQRIAAYDLLIFENNIASAATQKQNAIYLDSILILRPQLAEYVNQISSSPINFDRQFNVTQLSEKQGVLIFHQENNILHAILLNRNGLSRHTIEDVASLRVTLKEYSTFCRSENIGFSESQETLKQGAELYAKLLGWIPATTLDKLSRIATIESYPVENLPFAALPTTTIAASARGFRDVPFAVDRHAFSYFQSPSAFFDAQQLSHKASSINLTALAPSQISGEPIVATGITNSPTLGLAYADQEVEVLISKFKGTLLKGKQADFDGLLNAFNNGNVVHIASHASSNYSNGEYSYIVITDTSQLSGERLYARTISELELPADLVVLAACESGSGKLRSGEGTMSLASVFLNAGTQSVLSTGWRVEDKRSQEVLLGFYDALEKKQPLDQALVEAQRTYLQTAGGQYLHPFYWSSFAISGNMNPIDTTWSKFLFLGIPLALLGLFFLWWNRR